MSRGGRYGLAMTVALGLVLSLLFVRGAQAGCLMEYEGCANCARTALKRAMWRLDLGGIRKANFMMYDCAIDLYHCVVLGAHHDTPCAV